MLRLAEACWRAYSNFFLTKISRGDILVVSRLTWSISLGKS